MAEQSYQFDISSSQAVEFKSDLRVFAIESGYAFVDGSSETKDSREYINEEAERSSGKNPGLVSQGVEIIDVTVEPRNAESEFLIFAKTSAYNAEEVSVTVIYNQNSAVEKRMADNFEQSRFLRKWNTR